MKLKEAFEVFIHTKQADGLAPASIEAYKWQCKPLIDALGNLDITEIATDSLQNFFIKAIEGNEKFTLSTKISYRRSSRIFLKWVDEEYDNVSFRWDKIKIKKMPKKEIQTFTDEEIEELLASCNSAIPWIAKRDKALVALLLDSGIRRGEASTLLLKNVDFDNHRIIVTGKGNKQRMVHFGFEAESLLKEYLNNRPNSSKYLFCGIHTDQLTNNGISLLFNRLKSSSGHYITPHLLRHNFATNYCKDIREDGNEADPNKLQALMGHESLSVTQRYMHDELERYAADSCPSHLDRIARKRRP